MVLLEGIYSTVIMRDILERENHKGQKRITDPVLLKKIVMFLADNIGSNISVSSIGNTLVNEGLLEDGRRKGTPSAHTVQAYVNALLESYFFYFWNEANNEIRLVTSFDTTEEDVNQFIRLLRR